jgi:Tetratricopeptide repeat
MEKVLGREHPVTLCCMSCLASALQKQGKYKEAEQIGRQALEGRKTLGQEHPDTLSSMRHLAAVQQNQVKAHDNRGA